MSVIFEVLNQPTNKIVSIEDGWLFIEEDTEQINLNPEQLKKVIQFAKKHNFIEEE